MSGQGDALGNRAPERFDRTAANYATSAHHKGGRSLRGLIEQAGPGPEAVVLDLASGSGHAAVALAREARWVVACDPAPAMLEQVARAAAESGLKNMARVRALAEALPFVSGVFDIATCRIAAHHFPDIDLAMAELARVVKAGGRVVVSDLCGFEDPDLDAFSDALERLHDPTHVRSYTPERWRACFERAGLQVAAQEVFFEPVQGLLVSEWCRVAATPREHEEAIRALCRAAPAWIQEALRIVEEGDDVRLRARRIAITAGARG